MSAARAIAHAKLNLALHVRRREADGYHAIETLFAFCEDGDELQWREAPGLEVTGPFAAAIGAGADNLVLRAQQAFAGRFGVGSGGGFRLHKCLPVAAGIGGGSADAAAALRLLSARHGRDPEGPEVLELAAALGADVPACLLSRTSRGTGRGDRLVPVADPLPLLAVLLVNPGEPLATGPVFAGWDGTDRGALPDGDTLAVARAARNDLQPPACALLPVIGEVVALLARAPGAVLARMSGSGATCFALFEGDDARDAAASMVATARPDWWQMRTRLR